MTPEESADALAGLIARLDDPRSRVRSTLDRIVKDMAAAGYPVEMTHKADHRPDFIPDRTWTIEDDEGAEEALAWLIVGAWTSKHALIAALMFARKYAVEDAALRARAAMAKG